MRKFKSGLARTRADKREAMKYLIGISGGPSSRAMLHMVAQCCGNFARKKLLISVVVVYIDERGAVPNAPVPLEYLESIASQYNHSFPVYIAGLDMLYGGSTSLWTLDIFPRDSQSSSHARTAQLFAACNTGTASEDLLIQLRGSVLHAVAEMNHCSAILLGTSADRAATLLITNTSLGRGMAYPDVSFPSRHIPFLQPMRDFLLKEIVIYNRIAGIEWCFVPALSTKRHVKTSIHQLSEAFIAELQGKYAHTVHTLLKSADKLDGPSSQGQSCALCFSPLEPPIEEEGKEKEVCGTDACCGQGGGGGCGSGGCGNEDKGRRKYCYGCTRMMAECTPETEHLLPTIHHRPSLHSLIKDYLLE